MKNVENALVLVLGMHRSGTSSLTGILKELGLYTGLIYKNPLAMNNKGSQEAREVHMINEQLLLANKGSWFAPATINDYPEDLQRQANLFKAILRSENWTKQQILIKDPRMLYCYGLWEEPITYYIGSFRHPSKVVRSLEVRNKKNKKGNLNNINWLEVWYQYNKQLLEKYKQFPFPMVCFDWEESHYLDEINHIAKTYLSVDIEGKDISFFSKELKRNETTTILAAKYEELYEQLLEISRNNTKSNMMSENNTRTSGTGLSYLAGQDHYRAYVGPPEDYDLVSAMVFNLVTSLGLRQHHKIIDIGCGSLRNGRLLIPYLNKGNYIGIEPNEWLVTDGIANELGNDMIALKEPVFSYKASMEEFEEGALNADFAIAQSIFSHTGKQMTLDWLSQLYSHLNMQGILLATFIHAAEDSLAEGWIYPGCVRFKPETIAAMGRSCGFKVRFLKWAHPRQTWVAFFKKDFDPTLLEDGIVSWNKFIKKERLAKFKKLKALKS